MKEKDLLKLGFKKYHVKAEESGNVDYDYYCLKIGYVELITEDFEGVDVLEGDIRITDYKDLKQLINLLKKYEKINT